MNTFQINKTAVKKSALVLAFAAFAVTSCQQDDSQTPVVQPETRGAARASCLAQTQSNGSIQLGNTPKLQPVSSGTTDHNYANDCDYFVAFPSNAYQRIVSADLGDPEVGQQIRRLISDAPVTVGGVTVGGGFGGTLARGRRSPVQDPDGVDTRIFIILGTSRSNNYLSGMASARGTDVRSLLAKHLRMGNP